ncbi:McrB family protein [Leuconostoc mesenteroides]|uniref:McrB family protein n=1 Tax=Leuconostoc mesenteroides TaxID=1245 RepID=UPI002362C5C2|nr:hypothetical protein [Leuconostoc mesenteroides]
MALVEGLQKYEVIGYLESKDDIEFGKGGHAYIKMKTISDFPDSVEEFPFEEKIQVYVNSLRKYNLIDDEFDSEEHRSDVINEYFKNMLVIVQPSVSHSDDGISTFFQGKNNIKVLAQNDNFDPKQNLISLPIFEKYKNVASDIHNREEFEQKLLTEGVLGKVSNPLSMHVDDFPYGVIWKNGSDDYILYTGITNQAHASNGLCYKIDNPSWVNINNYDWISAQYEVENLIYIPKTLFQETLKNQLPVKQNVDKLINATQKDPQENDFQSKIIPNAPDEDFDEGGNNSEFLDHSSHEDTKKGQNSLRSIQKGEDEYQFLELFKYLTSKKKHLYYKTEDLINFHTAMKSDGLVVLSGLSGTGKSKLVSAYANALRLTIGEDSDVPQVRFIPVRPFWADDSDLLGYADLINSVYRPGDSGLVDTLIDASKYTDQIFLIVFDEMNLARVEHYFSQFLSVLEMDSNDRVIHLYNSQLENRLYNSETYKSTISVGDNVLFVGTVNTDESTHQFSDKVLDRSNVLSLDMIPFNEVENIEFPEINNELDKKPFDMQNYRAMKQSSVEKCLTNDEKEMLWKLHLELNSIDKNLGIGWRIVNQIDNYLTNLPSKNVGFSREQAIDYQVVQRILTKVKGTEEQLMPLLGTDKEKGSIEKILDEYPSTSKFENTRRLIHMKAKESVTYGFTL